MKRSITTRARLEEAEVFGYIYDDNPQSLKKRMSGAATYEARFQKPLQGRKRMAH